MSDLAFSPGDRVRMRIIGTMQVQEWVDYFPLQLDGSLVVEGVITDSRKVCGYLAYGVAVPMNDGKPPAGFIAFPNQLELLEAAMRDLDSTPAPAIGDTHDQPKVAA